MLIEHAGGLCVRYYRRADGTILLADCEVGQRRQRKRRWLAAAAAAGALGAGGLKAARDAYDSRSVMGEREVMMGDYSPISEQPSPAPAMHVEMGAALPPIEAPQPRASCPTMPMSEAQVAAQYLKERRRALGRKLTAAERQEAIEKARAEVHEDLQRHAECR